MKSVIATVLSLAALAVASPIAIEQRQIPGDTANEFTNGGCAPVIFIFARGSTETGNIGVIVGPELSADLKATLGASNVHTQGVTYAAGLATNFLPGGADPNGVAAMKTLFQQVNAQCPTAKIVAGGYSQGAAVTHEAITSLPSNIINQIVGVTLFGDTQFLQDGGVIINYPPANTKIYCAVGDLVCDGTLIITAAHLTYGVDAPDAAAFLAGKVNAS